MTWKECLSIALLVGVIACLFPETMLKIYLWLAVMVLIF